MKKLLMLALIGLSSSVIAATQGTSTLKLSNSDPDNTLRTARVALDHVNADIAELDQKISETRAQALAARAVPAANRSAGASLEALANAARSSCPIPAFKADTTDSNGLDVVRLKRSTSTFLTGIGSFLSG